MSRLSLPLSNRIPVEVAAVVVFRLPLPLPLPLSDCVPVALGRKVIMVTNMLIKNVSRLLMMLKDFCWSAFHD